MEYYEHLYFGIYMQSIQDMYDLIPLTWPVLMYTYKILWIVESIIFARGGPMFIRSFRG